MKLLSVAFLLSAISLSGSAFAAGSDAADARHRYEEGVAAFSKHDYPTAVAAFSDVFRATGETRHLWNLSLAEYEAHRSLDALAHLRQYAAKADANPKNVERAKLLITELTGKVGRIVVTAPAGSEVILDDAHVGSAPLAEALEVDPDKAHKLIARSATEEASQDLAAPGPNQVHVDLVFPVAPPPPAPVAVVPAATAPTALVDSPSTDQRRSNPVRTWLTVGLGVGAVAMVGVGVGMGIKSNSQSSDADKLRAGMPASACTNPNAPGCQALSQALSSQGSAHTASEVSYVVAGALAAGALASWIFIPHDRAPSDKAASFAPMFGAGVAGVSCAGRF